MADDHRIPNKDSKESSRRLSFLIKICAGLGIVQVYNIISHRQDLVSLSESVQLIAAWWRYIIRIPFEFIQWNLTPLLRELLVLLLFAGAAANVAWYRKFGHTLMYGVWRFAKPGHSLDEPLPKSINDAVVQTLGSISAIVTAFVLAVVVVYIIKSIPFVSIIVMPYLMILSPFAFWLRDDDFKKRRLLAILFEIAAAPMFAIICWLLAITAYRKEIIRSLRFLIIVLGADLAAKYGVDPLLAWVPRIPHPPSAAG